MYLRKKQWLRLLELFNKKRVATKKPSGFAGFTQNAKTDFGSFAKGMLGVGRELLTHPVYNAKQIYGVGKEFVKGTPQAVRDIYQTASHPIESTRKASESFNQLRQIPLEEQKRQLGEAIQKIGESDKEITVKKTSTNGARIIG